MNTLKETDKFQHMVAYTIVVESVSAGVKLGFPAVDAFAAVAMTHL